MKRNIEQLLTAARPRTVQGNTAFVAKTMAAIKQASATETFKTAKRKTNTTKRESIMKKIQSMPKRVALASGTAAVIILGGTAYAAFNWFGTSVTTVDQKGSFTVKAKDCPASLLQAYEDNGAKINYDVYTTWKIIKPSAITQQDVLNNQYVSCEQRAIDAVSKHDFPEAYDYAKYSNSANSYNGKYLPQSTYGTVTAITAKTLTVDDITVNHAQGPAEKVTVTLNVQRSTKILNAGKSVSLNTLKVGDKVYFTFQNTASNDTSVDRYSTPNSASSSPLVIGKTQYDYKAKDKLQSAVGNRAILLIKTNDQGEG